MRDTFTTTERDAGIVAAYDVDPEPIDPANADGMLPARPRSASAPSSKATTAIFCVEVRLAQMAVTGFRVEHVRDTDVGGVFKIHGASEGVVRAALDAAQYEVREHQGAIWVRNLKDFGADPWA